MSLTTVTVDLIPVEVDEAEYRANPEDVVSRVRAARAKMTMSEDEVLELTPIQEESNDSEVNLPEDHWDDEDDNDEEVEINENVGFLKTLGRA